MATIPPIVRQMVICDDVQPAAGDRPRMNVLGVTHNIRAKPGQSFPLRHPGLCAYLVLTGGVGTGRVQLRVSEAVTGDDLFGSAVHDINHPPARHEIAAVILRIKDCVFPRPGLYWVELHHDGVMIRREPVTVR